MGQRTNDIVIDYTVYTRKDTHTWYGVTVCHRYDEGEQTKNEKK